MRISARVCIVVYGIVSRRGEVWIREEGQDDHENFVEHVILEYFNIEKN